ncbi:hypothetical protein SBA4_3170004 [Candidatus Sulfopaludibacter sp. SbA4]|nr:hypothetical protein SBA4_3170004 [Candidatus Sulfopaludibacter sp. SbA4]
MRFCRRGNPESTPPKNHSHAGRNYFFKETFTDSKILISARTAPRRLPPLTCLLPLNQEETCGPGWRRPV